MITPKLKTERLVIFTPTILSAKEKGRRRALFRAASYIRTTARRMLGKIGKAKSKAGDPPRIHRNSPLKRLLFFGWDPVAQSVVIGPARLPGRPGPAVPGALEKGGPTRIPPRRTRKGRRYPARKTRIRPRPLMVPALDRGQDKLAEFLKDAITA